MSDLKTRYLQDAVATATPMQLVTMLYDRLLVDLHHGIARLEAGDPVAARVPIEHAEEIVSELMSTLDPSVWEGAQGLMSLYTWVLTELLSAEVTGDVTKVKACRDTLVPLADTWREAAAGADGPVAPTAGLVKPLDVLGVA